MNCFFSNRMTRQGLLLAFFLCFALTATISIPATVHAASDKAIQALSKGNKARARAIMLNRSIWGHFRAMDVNRDWNLTFREMDRYFAAMHKAFDANANGVVSVPEAPPIMMRYTVSGQPFPPQGLTRPTLHTRLKRLFVVLDKNRNGVLSIRELT